jgi:hypothetical protein
MAPPGSSGVSFGVFLFNSGDERITGNNDYHARTACGSEMVRMKGAFPLANGSFPQANGSFITATSCWDSLPLGFEFALEMALVRFLVLRQDRRAHGAFDANGCCALVGQLEPA